MIALCETCQRFKASQHREPLMPVTPDESPPVPWHTISTDLFTFDADAQDFLIIAGLHTRFPIVEILKTLTTSLTVTSVTLKHISMFGIPSVIISDNGPRTVHWEGVASDGERVWN